MRHYYLPIALLFATAACQAAPPPVEQVPARPIALPQIAVTDQPASVAPGNPVGEYAVTLIDGAPPQGIDDNGISVSIGSTRIAYQSQCINGAWNWGIADGAFATSRYYQPGSAMCARGLSDEERIVEETFDAATRYTIRPDETVLVEGGGHSLVLIPDPTRVGAGPITDAQELQGEYHAIAIDGEAAMLRDPVLVRFDGERLSYTSGCISGAWSYAFANGAIRVGETVPQAACRRALEPIEQVLTRALPAVTKAERMPGGWIDLTGGGHTITLLRR